MISNSSDSRLIDAFFANSATAEQAREPSSDQWANLLHQLDGDMDETARQTYEEHLHSTVDDVVELSDASTDDASHLGQGHQTVMRKRSRPPSILPDEERQSAVPKWPASAFFSDESSGWSSSSSDASVEKEAGEPDFQSQARVMLYNGSAVVEKDGWMYPADLFLSTSTTLENEKPMSSPSLAMNTAKGSDDDVPLAALYGCPVARCSDPPVALQRSIASSTSATPTLIARAPDAGFKLVGSHGCAMPVVPPISCGPAAHVAAAGPIADRYDMHSELDGFADDEVADMLDVTEELGGFRYGS